MKQKIVLMLLPFWTPLIPPVGIASLKSFLEKEDYPVKTFDGNTEQVFRGVYDRYFKILSENVPESKQGNFFNIGHDVLQDHLMAFMNRSDENNYRRLVSLIIEKNFYCRLDETVIRELDRLLDDFYNGLHEYIETIMTLEQPAVLGLSVYRGALPASLYVARHVKNTFPGTKIVVGGAVFSQELEVNSPNFKKFVESTSYIDKIIIGEGENLFLDYLEGKLPGNKKVSRLEDNKNILEINSLGVPDYSDFDIDNYPYVPVYGSRGCPFQCSFCAETINWGKYRKKTAQKIAGEMRLLHAKYGEQLFLMCDSLLNPIITDLAQELIKSERSLYWDGYLKIGKEVCDIDTVLLWRRAGFYRARIGVESGSAKILDSIGKKITLEQVRNGIMNLANLGIKTSTYWIVGYPGETEEDFQETLDLIEELKDDLYEAECNPFRYFITGQAASAQWEKNVRRYPLYPGEISGELLPVQTSVLDCLPSREEMYSRLCRFSDHCRRLAVPNPYSAWEIHQADNRWRELQENAAPPLAELKNKDTHISECRNIKILSYLESKQDDFSGNFDF